MTGLCSLQLSWLRGKFLDHQLVIGQGPPWGLSECPSSGFGSPRPVLPGELPGKPWEAQGADAWEGHPEGVQGTRGICVEPGWHLLEGAKQREGPRAGQVDPGTWMCSQSVPPPPCCPPSPFPSLGLLGSVFSRDSFHGLPWTGGDVSSLHGRGYSLGVQLPE